MNFLLVFKPYLEVSFTVESSLSLQQFERSLYMLLPCRLLTVTKKVEEGNTQKCLFPIIGNDFAVITALQNLRRLN